MCAILSVSTLEINLNQIDFQKSLNKQNYRGPDSQKIVQILPNTLFGFNRLAIQDLDERSMQPFELNKSTIIFNGEIYNFLELKSELSQLGHTFITTGDAEILIASLEQWGVVDAVKKLNGIFAFIYFNYKANELVAVRDAIGIKPLYYYRSNNGNKLIFSSDINSILTLTKAKLNQTTLQNGMLCDWFMTDPDETFLEGIKQVSSGNILVFDATNLHQKDEIQYFTREPKIQITSESEAANKYLTVLKQVIQKETRSDAMVGCTLSGGTDSTTVLALSTPHLLLKQSKIPVFTMNDTGVESSLDLESSIETLKELRKIYGDVYDHQIVDLTEPVTLEDFKKATIAMGRPVTEIRFITMTRFFEAMKKHGVKVVLTGQGSDELNYGYHPLSNWPLTAFYTNKKDFTAQNLFDEFYNVYAQKIDGFNETFKQKALNSFRLHLQNVFVKVNHIQDQRLKVTAILGALELQNVFSYEDHLSMYSGIEDRVPLANIDLVKLSDAIAPEIHLKSNPSGRHLLRLALKEVGLPVQIVNRDKAPTPKKQQYVDQLIKIINANYQTILNSELLKQVYSAQTLSNLNLVQYGNQQDFSHGDNRYGNIEDILLSLIGLWQFEEIYLKHYD